MFTRSVVQYAASHRHPINRTLHAVGVPALLAALVLSVAALPAVVGVPLAVALLCVGLLYVLEHPVTGAVVVGFVLAVSVLALQLIAHWGTAATLGIAAALAVVGSLLQVVGHWVEGRAPAALRSPRLVLAAPLFVAAEGLRRVGIESRIVSVLRGSRRRA